jgi:hypothetical protein
MGDPLLLKVKFVGRLGRNLRQLRRERGGHGGKVNVICKFPL